MGGVGEGELTHQTEEMGVGVWREDWRNRSEARRRLEVCQTQHAFIIAGKQILGGTVSTAAIKKAEEKDKICLR